MVADNQNDLDTHIPKACLPTELPFMSRVNILAPFRVNFGRCRYQLPFDVAVVDRLVRNLKTVDSLVTGFIIRTFCPEKHCTFLLVSYPGPH